MECGGLAAALAVEPRRQISHVVANRSEGQPIMAVRSLNESKARRAAEEFSPARQCWVASQKIISKPQRGGGELQRKEAPLTAAPSNRNPPKPPAPPAV